MKNLCNKEMVSMKLFQLILLLLCIVLLILPLAGCDNRGSTSGTGLTGAGSGSADLMDLDQKTPQMVCAEYFEAFRKRDMDTLKRCTTAKSFKEAKKASRQILPMKE